MYRGFSEPWLTRLGESELQVALSSRLRGMACALTVDGEPVEPEALWAANWSSARGVWPDAAEWRETPARNWISR